MKLGILGADSSHVPEFSKRIKARHDAGLTKCHVTHFWTDGKHDWPNATDIQKWRDTTVGLGVKPAESIEQLLGAVDGVLVLAVAGKRHLELAAHALKRGMPTYIDKPLTCELAEAQEVLRLAGAHQARCYSASSLRFATELEKLPREALGEIVAIDAFGPGELNDGAPGLLHYGVHTIEMVDAIWGPGVKRVSAIELPDRHLVDLEYRDGRYARLRLERKAAYEFGASVHGIKAVHQFKVDFGPVYDRLVAGMTTFFEGGPAPAKLRDIVENVAVMVAGNRSVANGGDWVEVPEIRGSA